MLDSPGVAQRDGDFLHKDTHKVKSNRPVNLKLSTLAFPPTAIASILHRISGIVLFLGLPFVLYIWQHSLVSAAAFAEVKSMFACDLVKIAALGLGAALIYHVMAGIRHVLGDMGWGDHLPVARWSAYGVIGLSVVLVLILGIIIW